MRILDIENGEYLPEWIVSLEYNKQYQENPITDEWGRYTSLPKPLHKRYTDMFEWKSEWITKNNDILFSYKLIVNFKNDPRFELIEEGK